MSRMGQIPVEIKEGKGRVFVCPYDNCKKESSRKYNIQAHMRIHTEQTPYTCNFSGCGMSFKWRSSLVNHERYHKKDDKLVETPLLSAKGPTQDTLKRLMSSTSTVTSDVSDKTSVSEDEKEQFYVAKILAEGFMPDLSNPNSDPHNVNGKGATK
eukprot:Plantae.Rhodophyta-Purpureofilum_apyrenoidigerum.ctg2508.p1 GENE.Plantae.Rhodophyta-Purpureofilum_apyrenoidigerum.ctg2508~~Plantae.Rhodophyta-Purpureofilum_apyrenoidigerum.ctg2508.p1  ORF type:complete len:155 (-),score=24.32 Plantae.Rhodophyta-Purpureofilum_apyrenoidigerum.ctg2508:659-1123(-)